MADIIPPIVQTPNLTPPESSIKGEISNLPAEVQEFLKAGQDLRLQIIKDMSFQPNAFKALVEINGQQVEVSVKLSGEIKNGQNFPDNIQVKVSATGDNKAEIKLPTANLSTNEIVKNQPRAETAVIVKNNQAFNNADFHPMKVNYILKTISKRINLPENVRQILKQNFSNAQVSIKIKDVSLANNMAQQGGNILPKGEVIQSSIERLELILNRFVAQTKGRLPNVAETNQVVEQIKNELLSLKNTHFTGAAFSSPDSKLLALRTVMGNFLPDNLMKMENQKQVLLEIVDVKLPDIELPKQNQEINASQNLSEKLISAVKIFKNLLAGVEGQELQKLVKIFEPLEKNNQTKLVAEIIQKFPGANENITESVLNYTKAALQKNVSAWLGKDLVQDLNRQGTGGQEVLNRLHEVVQSSIREVQNWKIIDMPILNGEQLSHIRIAIKNIEDSQEQNKKRRKGAKATRFVVDTNFTALGMFQFDGFSYRKERNFDLIIRTSKEIDDDLKKNIFAIFKTTLNALHYVGNIRINVKENFIKICENESQTENIKQGFYV